MTAPETLTLDRLLQSVADAAPAEDAGLVQMTSPQTRAVVRIRAALTPMDRLCLIAELAQGLPHGNQGVGNPCVSLSLGYSDEAYALIAEMDKRHLFRTVRMATAQIGVLTVAASGVPKIAGPDDSQMVRPDGPVTP